MYRAIINLIPHFETEEFRNRVGIWSSELYETITFSMHDAVSLVKNARPDSLIRIWNSDFFKDDDIDWILGQWENIEWRHLPGFSPSITDLIPTLPTGDGRYATRHREDILFLTIHHTVGWDFTRSNQSNAITIAQNHSAKWPGIGYHFLIGPDGEIMQTNNIETISYHTGTLAAPGDENKASIGIAMGGDFRNAPPPDAQWAAASSLVENLKSNSPNYLAVLPHKRMPGAATICPGYFIESWLKLIGGTTKWI